MGVLKSPIDFRNRWVLLRRNNPSDTFDWLVQSLRSVWWNLDTSNPVRQIVGPLRDTETLYPSYGGRNILLYVVTSLYVLDGSCQGSWISL